MRNRHGDQFTFAYHDRIDMGVRALRLVAKDAGLTYEELRKLL